MWVVSATSLQVLGPPFTAFAHFRDRDGFPGAVILDPEGGSGCGVFEFGFHGFNSFVVRISQRLMFLPLALVLQRGEWIVRF